MLVVFPPIFAADTKKIYGYNFVAPVMGFLDFLLHQLIQPMEDKRHHFTLLSSATIKKFQPYSVKTSILFIWRKSETIFWAVTVAYQSTSFIFRRIWYNTLKHWITNIGQSLRWQNRRLVGLAELSKSMISCHSKGSLYQFSYLKF